MSDNSIMIEVKVEKILILNSKKEWINRCPRDLPNKIYERDEFIFIDRHGQFLDKGLDFKIADEENCFPVTVYRKVFTRNYKFVEL